MDPIIGGGIVGITGLIGNLLSMQAQRDMQKKKMEQEALQAGFQAQSEGAKSLSGGQMQAYQQLLGGLKSALIGG